jgi:hypothetical protein
LAKLSSGGIRRRLAFGIENKTAKAVFELAASSPVLGLIVQLSQKY